MKSEMQSNHSHAPAVATLIAVAILLVLSNGSALGAGVREKVVYSFQGGSDGAYPSEFSGLIADKDGNLYGTTGVGGSSSACSTGCGTVFKLSPPTTQGGAWTETQLYVFQGGSSDGANPDGALVFDKIGNLYGTTAIGGSGSGGIVFELSPPVTSGGAWSETVLYAFPADGSHGTEPFAGLVFDSGGNLYGTTHYGGSTNCGGGCGTAFELSPPAAPGGSWIETVIHEFGVAKTDGAYPWSGLAIDRTNALYGTISGGKTQNGAVYQLVRRRGVWSQNILYAFAAGAVGEPLGGVIFDSAGNLYGTGFGGAIQCGPPQCGGVFELIPPVAPGDPWTETTLYTFAGGKDGAYPLGKLMQDKAGNLYGVTNGGGIRVKGTLNGNGTVFQLSPPTVPGGTWTEAILHYFNDAGVDASGPAGGLVVIHGKFYGAGGGGSAGQGTVYSLVVP